MESSRTTARIVAGWDLMITSLGLGQIWWKMDPIDWMDSVNAAVHLIIMDVIILSIMAAIGLFIASLQITPPVRALKLCHFWRFLNSTWICLEMLAIILITGCMIAGVGNSFLGNWTPLIIPVIQIELSLRLAGMLIVIKFIEKLKSTIVTDAGDIRLHAFPSPPSTNSW